MSKHFRKNKKKNPNLSIEHQYKLFLGRMSLSEETMHPQQKIQLKETFFGAFGQALIMMRDDIGGLENEDDAVDAMQNCLNQVGHFFNSKMNKDN